MTTPQRYALATSVGVVYALAAAWLVGVEGRSYRESLRESRARGREVVATAPAPAGKPVAEMSPVPPQGELRPAQSGRAENIRPATPPTIADKQVETKAPPAVALNTAVPKPITIPKAVPPAERSPGEIWADTLDLSSITPEQEMRLGGELHRLVLATTPVDPDGDLQRLGTVAGPLLKLRARPEIAYTFTVLYSDAVNAFSLPGGFIYVSKGLFSLVGEEVEPEEDYALQFAVGHEIAHVDLRHALKLLAPGNAEGKRKGIDTLHQCLIPLMVAYPDAMEFEADTWAFDRMTSRIEPRRTRREGLMFLLKLEGFAKKNGFKNGRMSLDPASGMTLVENHYRAHPAAWDRLARLKGSDSPAKAADPKP